MRRFIQSVGIVLFAAVLVAPVVQMLTGIVPKVGLSGVEPPGPPISKMLNFWGFKSGELARRVERQFGRELGLRGVLVRTDNELNYRVFGAMSGNRFVGKDDTLFTVGYSPGRDWVAPTDDAVIGRLVESLAAGQKAFRVAGLTLLPLVSPIKTRFAADLLPDDVRRVAELDERRQIDEFREQAEAAGLLYLDGPKLFDDLRPRARAPLFPRGGVHWSNYGAAEVLVEMVRILDVVDERWDFVALEITRVEPRNKPRPPDDDLAQLSNVWSTDRFFGESFEPTLRWVEGSGGRRPRVLFIGTSFTWQLATQASFRDVEVYYYNRTRFTVQNRKRRREGPVPNQADPAFLDELTRFDLVVLEAPEHALRSMNWEDLIGKVGQAVAAAESR